MVVHHKVLLHVVRMHRLLRIRMPAEMLQAVVEICIQAFQVHRVHQPFHRTIQATEIDTLIHTVEAAEIQAHQIHTIHTMATMILMAIAVVIHTMTGTEIPTVTVIQVAEIHMTIETEEAKTKGESVAFSLAFSEEEAAAAVAVAVVLAMEVAV